MILSLQDKIKASNNKHSVEINDLRDKLDHENDVSESLRFIIEGKEKQNSQLEQSLKEVRPV